MDKVKYVYKLEEISLYAFGIYNGIVITDVQTLFVCEPRLRLRSTCKDITMLLNRQT